MKVMLADRIEKEEVKFPVMASPKLDGVRCFIEMVDGKVQASSRTGKPIPNHFIQSILGGDNAKPFLFLDGELMCGNPADPDIFRKTTSSVMSRGGSPDFTFYVFDYAKNQNDPFEKRYEDLKCLVTSLNHPNIKLVEHTIIENLEDLTEFGKKSLQENYEGVMVRSLSGKYKQGRSTKKQGWLLKIKEFYDAEAEIIGFEELLHNENAEYLNELGYTKRSTMQENMIPAGTLGSLVVRCLDSSICDLAFSIGTGFDMAERDLIWKNREEYLGKIIRFKYFPSGSKERPRFPVYQGIRNKEDM